MRIECSRTMREKREMGMGMCGWHVSVRTHDGLNDNVTSKDYKDVGYITDGSAERASASASAHSAIPQSKFRAQMRPTSHSCMTRE